MNRHAPWLLLIAICATLGCGDPNGRQPISGKVYLDGQPLDDGTFSLRPLGQGPSTGGPIEDGAFTLRRAQGPVPGSYRVEINAFEQTGRLIALVDAPDMKIEERAQVIPDRYNERTELRIEVTDGGDNEFEFELSTTPTDDA